MNRCSPLLAVLPLLGGLLACQPHESHAAHEPPATDVDAHAQEGVVHVDAEVAAAQGIRVARAERRALIPFLTVPGRVALNPDGLARVATPVAGRVSAVLVQPGAEVAAGAVLLTLLSPEFAAAQREFVLAEQSVEASRAPEQLARTSWQRAVELHAAHGDPSLAELQRRESELLRLEAETAAAAGRALLARDRLRLWGVAEERLQALLAGAAPADEFELRAPAGGRVIERAATIGQYAEPAGEPLVTIADLTDLWVLANFPESRLRELRVGAAAQVLLESEPGHGCPGLVQFISPVLDLATRTVEVRIRPEDRHEDLRPGSFARVEIETPGANDEHAAVIAVPETAVMRVDGRSVVFVPVAGDVGAYALRAVRAGRAVHGWMPVLAGLAEGEEYVAEGAFLLKAELEESDAGHDH